ncbi:coiled-coil domain-containing protein 103 [Nilaparvata lugens]|uniref:coiled-coil domain-containing protein 103 n=1 Tax=Nilaparvata lugens TaxID=108931 RepID=UPI00193D7AFA|nr:coiled-coil domain-containing protein 103 [Nilaparvata lugens]
MTQENTSQRASIDLKGLQEELQKAIDDDKRYWLENDAKFRAVDQGTITYDEFRDIVKAAHLQPLECKDLKNLSTSHKGCIWNLVSGSSGTSNYIADESSNSTANIENLTMTKESFLKNFKKCSTDQERFVMLRNISVDGEIPRIFSLEIPVDLMSSIVRALIEFDDNPESIKTVYSILKHFTKVQRFELGLQFLSSIEKKEYGKLFDKLLASTQVCQQDLVQLGITECEIKLLREKYKV